MSRCCLSSPKLLTIAMLALLPVLPAFAGPQSAAKQQDGRQERSKTRDSSSLSDAVRSIERDTRGEVLSAERVQYDGRDMHRVKVVDDAGRVRVFMQDPSRRDQTANPNRNSSPTRSQPNRSSANPSSPNRSDSRNDGSRGSQQRQRPTRDRDD